MKNKKIWLAAGALLLVVIALLGIYWITHPPVEDDGKDGSLLVTESPDPSAGTEADPTQPEESYRCTITVTVVHKDGTSRDFTCKTNEEYLGPVLLDTGIVTGDIGPYGLYIDTADGEVADYSVDGGWWRIFEGDTPVTIGVDSIVITDGGIYKLVYTCG